MRYVVVVKTIAGYAAHLYDESGPICSSGFYHNDFDSAERDAIEWANFEHAKYESPTK